MSALSTLTRTEAKLFVREPMALFVTLLLPAAMVGIYGLVYLGSKDDPGAQEYIIKMIVASAVPLPLALLALNVVPTLLAGYREKGILRRMSASPANPALVLVAQFLIYLVVALVEVAMVLVVAKVAFGIPLPETLLGYVGVTVFAAVSLIALGLLVAAVAPSARSATGIGMVIYLVSLLLGGVFLPGSALPDILARIGEFTPVGAAVHAMQDTWLGEALRVQDLAVMGVGTVVLGFAATRLFRWE